MYISICTDVFFLYYILYLQFFTLALFPDQDLCLLNGWPGTGCSVQGITE